MWGKNVATLKGKTVGSKAPHIQEKTLLVPRKLLKSCKEVTMEVDVFFVNKIAFFLSVSYGICCTSVNHLSQPQVNGDPEFESLAS